MADFGMLIGGIGQSGFIGRAIVGLDLDTKKYQAELAAANAKTNTGANQMSSTMAKFGGFAKAAFLGVGVAAVAGIGVAIKAGSDLNEQINKSREVFGAASDKVIEFSEATASGLGIAQAEALTAAGSLGTMFDSAGLASRAAADMSVKMVELGADLGSFNNIPVGDALEKIRAGLAGEAEPLRQLGVFLNEARVEAEAFRSGIAEAGDELTDSQKIQARYNIILQDSTKAQGDFARTVGTSLPNQLKVLKAELIDVAANLGTALLPIVLEVVKVFKLLVPLAKFAADNLGLILGVVAGFAAVKYLPGLLLSIASGLEAIGAASLANGVLSVAAAMSTLATAAGGAVLAAGALPVIAYKIVQAIDPVEPAMIALNERMKEFGVVRGPAMAEAAERLAEKLAGDQSAMQAKAGLAEQGILNLGGATAKTRAEFEKTRGAVKDFADMSGDELKDWQLQTKESFRTAIFALEDLTTESAITTEDVVIGFRTMRQEARELGRAMNSLKDERWINDEFKVFLSEQGPAWLIGFADANERQQRRMQEQWQMSERVFNQGLKGSFLDLQGALDKMDQKETKHTVRVKYVYEGFDPTKPGMAGVQRSQ